MQPEDPPVRPPAHPQLEWRDLMPRGAARHRWARIGGAERIRTTYSGRAAIYQYLVALRGSAGDPRRNRVLVPAFHCPTVVDPILHAGYEVRYYRIDRALEVDGADFLRKLDASVAAAIFIRYFGVIATDRALFAPCRAAGAAVIEDCAHAFLAANPLRLAHSDADATIYSFWKLVPSRVGGGVLAPQLGADAAWPAAGRSSARDSLMRLRRLAGELYEGPRAAMARLLRRPPPHEVARPIIRKAAAEAYPYDPVASTWPMPVSARTILANADLESVVNGRRANYAALAERVTPSDELKPLRRDLPRDACPWGFPVLLGGRGERDYLLRASGVPVFSFGEVLHPTLQTCREREPEMVASAEYLSNSLRAIGVHQGIPRARVADIAELINRFVARP